MIQPVSAFEPSVGLDEESVQRLPDGAISVDTVEGNLVLRASDKLQQRFEELLERQKAGTLAADEAELYEAICRLDHSLSWLNRLAREPRVG